MDFTHAYHVAYNMPPRIVSIGLFVKCNINYLTIYSTGQCHVHGCTLRVEKAETVPVFRERIYYSTIIQARYNLVHDRPANYSPGTLENHHNHKYWIKTSVHSILTRKMQQFLIQATFCTKVTD